MAKVRVHTSLPLVGYRDEENGLYYVCVTIDGADQSLAAFKLAGIDFDAAEARQAAAEQALADREAADQKARDEQMQQQQATTGSPAWGTTSPQHGEPHPPSRS